MSDATSLDRERARAGLCADCAHARQVVSARGSGFYRCARSTADPRYPRYPRLPVVECRGYEPRGSQDQTP
jgi:hypothetical protein